MREPGESTGKVSPKSRTPHHEEEPIGRTNGEYHREQMGKLSPETGKATPREGEPVGRTRKKP